MKSSHILLVDEDEDLRLATKLHLDRMGHRTTAVGDAPQHWTISDSGMWILSLPGCAFPICQGLNS